MKFYATIEPCRKLKNLFSNLSSFYIIDIDTILQESGLDPDKDTHRYLINSEVTRLIVQGARSKRYKGMIYINSRINKCVVESIRASIDDMTNSVVESICVLDDADVPKLESLYTLFDEVIFFPSMRKSKIIECKPIKNRTK